MVSANRVFPAATGAVSVSVPPIPPSARGGGPSPPPPPRHSAPASSTSTNLAWARRGAVSNVPPPPARGGGVASTCRGRGPRPGWASYVRALSEGCGRWYARELTPYMHGYAPPAREFRPVYTWRLVRTWKMMWANGLRVATRVLLSRGATSAGPASWTSSSW
eukprot:42758-Prorocentrum_minimum.AAC.2